MKKLLILLWLVPCPVLADVVAVPVATVHREAAPASECVTQAELGEHVHVVRNVGRWAEVHVDDQYRLADGYPGWILKSDLAPDGDPAGTMLVTSPSTALHSIPGGPVSSHAYMGTQLAPTGKQQDAWLEVQLPQGTRWVSSHDVSPQPLPADAAGVIKSAEAFMGTPYVWGGISRDGIDCSGLTFIAYRVHGIALPRDADQQFAMGVGVPQAQLRPGDLVFYGRSVTHITHVGMYLGAGRILEASSDAHQVRESALDHRADYRGARRILGVKLTMPPPSP